MTRRDFEAVAKGVREAVLGWSPESEAVARQAVAESLADILATTNARFDRERFIRACIGEDK